MIVCVNHYDLVPKDCKERFVNLNNKEMKLLDNVI